MIELVSSPLTRPEIWKGGLDPRPPADDEPIVLPEVVAPDALLVSVVPAVLPVPEEETGVLTERNSFCQSQRRNHASSCLTR